MENKLILHGRGVYPGTTEGYAIVCPDGIAGNSGSVGDTDGIIYEARSSARGQCIQDKILVLPGAKGSSGFSVHFKSAMLSGFSPRAWIALKIDSRLGGTIASMRVPAVADFTNGDPLSLIHTGDYLRVCGDTGTVEVIQLRTKDCVKERSAQASQR